MAGIVDLGAVVGNKQMFNSHVNTDGFVGFWQDLVFKFAQARNKVPASAIFRNSYRAWLSLEVARPSNIKRFLAFGYIDFPINVLEPGLGKLSGLPSVLLLEDRIPSASVKEVFERCLLMPKALLQRHARNTIKVGQLRKLLDFGQLGASLSVADLFFCLVVRISSPTQDFIVYLTNTAERLSKQSRLLIAWVEPVFVCYTFHDSHFK
jgi:hypothetical protein